MTLYTSVRRASVCFFFLLYVPSPLCGRKLRYNRRSLWVLGPLALLAPSELVVSALFFFVRYPLFVKPLSLISNWWQA
jgi:hypothetical protein